MVHWRRSTTYEKGFYEANAIFRKRCWRMTHLPTFVLPPHDSKSHSTRRTGCVVHFVPTSSSSSSQWIYRMIIFEGPIDNRVHHFLVLTFHFALAKHEPCLSTWSESDHGLGWGFVAKGFIGWNPWSIFNVVSSTGLDSLTSHTIIFYRVLRFPS